ncbi:alpha/beta hydrolase [Aggregatibacter actinomycetemcomitans]|uniref:alpha/beta hydrolase n=1 Tax=Aggregatibacter actinomycetemcomitans TaxID=714 RepID=UPI00197C911E|nr:alpha/beta hydrolase [Aggregatibacter actinomycetemcomitans]MBN6085386.1 alpha/beta hydrolase [Aggregatibacter actinomycetemcomitans]
MMENHRSEQIDRPTDMCRANVTIYHHDTLKTADKPRWLADGIEVTVFDEAGQIYRSRIEGGKSVHLGVRCGEICWQLCGGAAVSSTYSKKDNRRLTEESEHTPFKASDGYVLIKARNRISDGEDEFSQSQEPLKQLANPLKVQVSFSENEVEAVYLPPPILVNLRLRQNEPAVQLTERVIQQLIDDGGHATLFIHGYNVPLGTLGRFASSTELGERIQYRFQMPPESVQRPYLYHDNKLMKQATNADLHRKLEKNFLTEGVSYVNVGDREIFSPNAMKKSYEKLSPILNGKEALSWFPHVEYHLNLAASGKKNLSDFEQWDKYSRIVGVTWSGSVDPDLNFFRAEMYANEAGRKLATVLKKLLDKGIKINIITHSLGARVALSAMNILGDMEGQYDNRIDNLILWEAAVADNALTNLDNYEAKKAFNPIAMEIFPYANKVPKHITVLYSQEDGVLGGDNTYRDYEPVALIGGAYPSKYLSFTTGNSALKEYYKDTQIYHYEKHIIDIKHTCDVLYAGSDEQYRPDKCATLPHAYQLARYKKEIEELIREEARKVNDPANSPTFIPTLKYLKPWSHFRRFPEEVLKHIIDVLTGNVLSDWEKRDNYFKVRAALGHQGDRQTIDHLDKKLNRLSTQKDAILHDLFLEELRDKKKKLHYFGQVIDQDDGTKFYYFISHSAMRTWEWLDLDKHQVFPSIYEYSYKEWIMDRFIQKHSKFGRYP